MCCCSRVVFLVLTAQSRALPVRCGEVWRRGSVIASRRLDLTAAALVEDPNLSKFSGPVSDSGEGRWTVKGGYRRSCAGTGSLRCALRTIQFARPCGLREQIALGDALRVRRPFGEGRLDQLSMKG